MDPTEAGRLASVRESYQAAAAAYDRAIRPTFGMVARRLAELVVPRPDDRGLDLAAGTGVVAEALLESCRELSIVGLDLSQDMIELLRRRVPAVTPVIGSAGHLPFRTGTFDLVTCQFGLHHFPNPGAALVEARRVAGPGGRLGLAFWHDGDAPESAIERVYADTLADLAPAPDRASPAVPAGRPDPARDADSVRDLAVAAGWIADVAVEPVRFRFAGAAEFVEWRTAFPGDALRIGRLTYRGRAEALDRMAARLGAGFPGAIEVIELVAYLRGR